MSNLDTTNYLALLIEFCFSILFLFIFVPIHYTLSSKTKLGKTLAKSKAISFWYYFAFGFVLSLVTFISSQATMLSLKSAIGLPITILCLIFAMSFFYNRSVQIGALIPTIIWVLYSFDGFANFSWPVLWRIVIILLVFVVSLITSFIKWKKWPLFVISLLVAILGSLGIVFGLWESKSTSTFYIVELAASFGFGILFFAIINWFNNMLSTMSFMAQSNLYTKHSYIIPSAIEQQFNQLIKEQNLSQALIVSFYIKKVNSTIIKKIADTFEGSKVILFKSEYDRYGAIIYDNALHISKIQQVLNGNVLPERENNDPLLYLQTKLKNIDVVAFASIYGVQSNDINELLKFNEYAITQYDATTDLNKIQMFDSNMLNNKIKDDINYAQLIQKIDLNDINVELEIIETNKDHKLYICPRFYWIKMATCDVNEIMKQFDLTTSNALLRSLAIKSLEKYALSEYKGKIPLIIFYPINELTNKYFSVTQFIKKVNSFGVDKSHIILSFGCKQIRLWPRAIINNLIEIEKNNIKFILVDLINTFCLTLLKPEAIILDSTIEKNKVKFEKAMEIIKTFKQNVLLTNKI